MQAEIVEEGEFFKIEKETTENELREKLASMMKDNVILIQRLKSESREKEELLERVKQVEEEREKADLDFEIEKKVSF